MIGEVKKSLEKNIGEKLVSPFWGAYIGSWLIWNWKIWYITFFVESNLLLQRYSMLKLDYITNLYNLCSFWDIIYSLSHLFIFPGITAYLVIFELPKITYKFYKQSVDDDYKSREYKEEKERRHLESKKSRLEVEEVVVEKEKNIESMKSQKTQQEEWDEEYENFKNSRYYNSFSQLKESIYSHKGETYPYFIDANSRQKRKEVVDVNVKAYFNSSDVIEIFFEEGVEKIRLTEKGLYFMSKFLDDK